MRKWKEKLAVRGIISSILAISLQCIAHFQPTSFTQDEIIWFKCYNEQNSLNTELLLFFVTLILIPFHTGKSGTFDFTINFTEIGKWEQTLCQKIPLSGCYKHNLNIVLFM